MYMYVLSSVSMLSVFSLTCDVIIYFLGMYLSVFVLLIFSHHYCKSMPASFDTLILYIEVTTFPGYETGLRYDGCCDRASTWVWSWELDHCLRGMSRTRPAVWPKSGSVARGWDLRSVTEPFVTDGPIGQNIWQIVVGILWAQADPHHRTCFFTKQLGNLSVA